MVRMRQHRRAPVPEKASRRNNENLIDPLVCLNDALGKSFEENILTDEIEG
jgi:hypothetical protein